MATSNMYLTLFAHFTTDGVQVVLAEPAMFYVYMVEFWAGILLNSKYTYGRVREKNNWCLWLWAGFTILHVYFCLRLIRRNIQIGKMMKRIWIFFIWIYCLLSYSAILEPILYIKCMPWNWHGEWENEYSHICIDKYNSHVCLSNNQFSDINFDGYGNNMNVFVNIWDG